jgi:hypothetical protein
MGPRAARREGVTEVLVPPRIQFVVQILQLLQSPLLLRICRHDSAHQVLSARVQLALIPLLQFLRVLFLLRGLQSSCVAFCDVFQNHDILSGRK